MKITHVSGRCWYSSRSGNTTHSVTLFWVDADGSLRSSRSGEHYGNHWLQTAQGMVDILGFEKLEKNTTLGGYVEAPWQTFKRLGVSTEVVDVARERDLYS